jgi:hypothetical protein
MSPAHLPFENLIRLFHTTWLSLGETEQNEHAVLEVLGDYKRDTGMSVENVSANYFP